MLRTRSSVAKIFEKYPGLYDCGDTESQPCARNTQKNRHIHNGSDLDIVPGITHRILQHYKRVPARRTGHCLKHVVQQNQR